MQTTLEIPRHKGVNGSTHQVRPLEKKSKQKQRVTITLPVHLLERMRNAVYWTGHGTLARLITEALDDAVCHMEETNGQPFPERLEPLKRGRPSKKTQHQVPFVSESSN